MLERERKSEYNGKTDGHQNGDLIEDEDESSGSVTDASGLGVHDATNHEEFEEYHTTDGAHSAGDNQTDAETTANSGTATSRESHTRVAGKGLLSRAKDPVKQMKNYNEDKSELHRKHKGLMQWRPVRNLQFAKNEAKFAVRRTLNKGTLQGRKPDVESEF